MKVDVISVKSTKVILLFLSTYVKLCVNFVLCISISTLNYVYVPVIYVCEQSATAGWADIAHDREPIAFTLAGLAFPGPDGRTRWQVSIVQKWTKGRTVLWRKSTYHCCCCITALKTKTKSMQITFNIHIALLSPQTPSQAITFPPQILHLFYPAKKTSFPETYITEDDWPLYYYYSNISSSSTSRFPG